MAASSVVRPCIRCGEPTDRGSRCPAHQRPRPHQPPPEQRGYDQAWRKLSRQARQLQPYCSTCGSNQRLSVDHSPAAWAKVERGGKLTLADFAAGLLSVECLPCNIAKGHARGSDVHRAGQSLDNPPGD